MNGPPLSATVSTADSPLPSDWDALCGAADLYASSAWLDAQASRFVELEGVAATVREPDGTLVAGLPMFPLQDDAPVSSYIHPARLLALSLPEADTRRLMPALLCGGRQPSVTRAPTDAARDRGALVVALIDAALTHARASALSSVAFLYVDEHDGALRGALRNAGFTEVPRGHRFVLDVEWPDFAGYLASRAGHRRRRIQYEMRRFAQHGVRMETTEIGAVPIDVLVDLTAQRRAKYGKETDRTSIAIVFERLCEEFGTRAKVFLARIDGRVAGYTLALEWREALYAWSTGFDYALQGGWPLYFGVTYYEPIAHAAKRGFSAIDYGPTADQAKLLRGCRAIRQYSYFRAVNADLDRWLREQIAAGR